MLSPAEGQQLNTGDGHRLDMQVPAPPTLEVGAAQYYPAFEMSSRILSKPTFQTASSDYQYPCRPNARHHGVRVLACLVKFCIGWGYLWRFFAVNGSVCERISGLVFGEGVFRVRLAHLLDGRHVEDVVLLVDGQTVQ